MKKRCSSCGIRKLYCEFHKNRNAGDGLQGWCKFCYRVWRQQRLRTDPQFREHHLDGQRQRRKGRQGEQDRQYARQYRTSHPGKAQRDMLLWRHGLTPDERRQMSIAQQHRCLICQRHVKLYIDHDHATGKIRGLLCNRCNLMLGHAKDDTEILGHAIRYLRR